MPPDLRALQRALGGEISGAQLLCPGPGHSQGDRSLAVRPSGDKLVVHAFFSPRQLAGLSGLRARPLRRAAMATGRRAGN